MKIKRYQLASASDPQELQAEVTKLLAEGWQPLGQLVVDGPSDNSHDRFLQPMVQYEGEIRSG